MKSSPGGRATNPRLFYFSRLPSFHCSPSWAGCWACSAEGSGSGPLTPVVQQSLHGEYLLHGRLHNECRRSAPNVGVLPCYAASCCGLISPSSHCCCSARARHAASILVYRFLAGTLLASLASCAQFSARSRYLCEWLIGRLIGELELLSRALERGTKINVPNCNSHDAPSPRRLKRGGTSAPARCWPTCPNTSFIWPASFPLMISSVKNVRTTRPPRTMGASLLIALEPKRPAWLWRIISSR